MAHSVDAERVLARMEAVGALNCTICRKGPEQTREELLDEIQESIDRGHLSLESELVPATTICFDCFGEFAKARGYTREEMEALMQEKVAEVQKRYES